MSESLKTLLQQALDMLEEQALHIEAPMLPAGEELLKRIRAATSQQAEPAPAQDELRARCAEILEWQQTGLLPGDALLAFAASQPYASDPNRLQMAEADTARQAYQFVVRAEKVEPAPAQDEREAFEASFKTLEAGLSLDGIYVLHMAKEIYWQGWQARATRPAQTASQPEQSRVDTFELPELGRGLNPLDASAHWITAYRAATGLTLAEAREEGRRRRAALSAQGADEQ